MEEGQVRKKFHDFQFEVVKLGGEKFSINKTNSKRYKQVGEFSSFQVGWTTIKTISLYRREVFML